MATASSGSQGGLPETSRSKNEIQRDYDTLEENIRQYTLTQKSFWEPLIRALQSEEDTGHKADNYDALLAPYPKLKGSLSKKSDKLSKVIKLFDKFTRDFNHVKQRSLNLLTQLTELQSTPPPLTSNQRNTRPSGRNVRHIELLARRGRPREKGAAIVAAATATPRNTSRRVRRPLEEGAAIVAAATATPRNTSRRVRRPLPPLVAVPPLSAAAMTREVTDILLRSFKVREPRQLSDAELESLVNAFLVNNSATLETPEFKQFRTLLPPIAFKELGTLRECMKTVASRTTPEGVALRLRSVVCPADSTIEFRNPRAARIIYPTVIGPRYLFGEKIYVDPHIIDEGRLKPAPVSWFFDGDSVAELWDYMIVVFGEAPNYSVASFKTLRAGGLPLTDQRSFSGEWMLHASFPDIDGYGTSKYKILVELPAFSFIYMKQDPRSRPFAQQLEELDTSRKQKFGNLVDPTVWGTFPTYAQTATATAATAAAATAAATATATAATATAATAATAAATGSNIKAAKDALKDIERISTRYGGLECIPQIFKPTLVKNSSIPRRIERRIYPMCRSGEYPSPNIYIDVARLCPGLFEPTIEEILDFKDYIVVYNSVLKVYSRMSELDELDITVYDRTINIFLMDYAAACFYIESMGSTPGESLKSRSGFLELMNVYKPNVILEGVKQISILPASVSALVGITTRYLLADEADSGINANGRKSLISLHRVPFNRAKAVANPEPVRKAPTVDVSQNFTQEMDRITTLYADIEERRARIAGIEERLRRERPAVVAPDPSQKHSIRIKLIDEKLQEWAALLDETNKRIAEIQKQIEILQLRVKLSAFEADPHYTKSSMSFVNRTRLNRLDATFDAMVPIPASVARKHLLFLRELNFLQDQERSCLIHIERLVLQRAGFSSSEFNNSDRVDAALRLNPENVARLSGTPSRTLPESNEEFEARVKHNTGLSYTNLKRGANILTRRLPLARTTAAAETAATAATAAAAPVVTAALTRAPVVTAALTRAPVVTAETATAAETAETAAPTRFLPSVIGPNVRPLPVFARQSRADEEARLAQAKRETAENMARVKAYTNRQLNPQHLNNSLTARPPYEISENFMGPPPSPPPSPPSGGAALRAIAGGVSAAVTGAASTVAQRVQSFLTTPLATAAATGPTGSSRSSPPPIGAVGATGRLSPESNQKQGPTGLPGRTGSGSPPARRTRRRRANRRRKTRRA